jgi:hypothetical protein
MHDVEIVMRARADVLYARIALLAILAVTPTLVTAQSGPSSGLPAAPPNAIDPATTSLRPGQRPDLSAEQRTTIFRTVQADKNKTARTKFPVEIGAEVPPALELHSLPDDALIAVPVAKMFKCVVIDGKVVLVDPTTMRVAEVIER